MPYEHARVHARNAYDVMLLKILLKTFFRCFAAERVRKIIYHKAADLRSIGLLFFAQRAVVADVWRGVDNNLTVVRRVCINLLVSRHPGVETNFTAGRAGLSDSDAFYQKAVLQEEICFAQGS